MKRFASAVVALMTAIALWAQSPPPKQVEIFGQKIHYLEMGSGPTVILLHGLGGDMSNWMEKALMGTILANKAMVTDRSPRWPLVPLSAGQMMGTEIIGSQSVILDHCGHVPQIECAMPFNAALMKFLASGAGTSTAGIQ